MAAPHIPTPANDGDRQATTNVERRASVFVAPCCSADWKCSVNALVSGIERGSEGVNAITSDTKSAMAAAGLLDDHWIAPGCDAGGVVSMVAVDRYAHTFSSAAR